MERENFIFYKDWKVSLDSLPNQLKLEFYDAIVNYGLNETESATSPVVKMAMTFVKTQIDRNNKKYNVFIQKQRDNGSLGGRPKKTQKEKVFIEQKNTEETINLEKFAAFWNEAVEGTIIPKVRTITGERKRMLLARMHQYGKKAIFDGVNKIRDSDFLKGNTGWSKFCFDWFVKPSNFAKIIEGNYDNKNTNNATDVQQQTESEQRASQAAIRIQRLLGEDDKERFGEETQ